MSLLYAYVFLAAIFAAVILKLVIDFRNISRLSRINKKNRKLDSICVVFKYENSVDNLIDQIRLLKIRKNKLIKIAVLVRSNLDATTKKKIINDLKKYVKNQTFMIEFKNIRGITAALKNNCGTELVMLLDKNQKLSQEFIMRVIKISSSYKNQPIFYPYSYQRIGTSLGNLADVRNGLFSKFYQQIFGVKLNVKQIQPGIVYRISELQKKFENRIPVDSICQLENQAKNLNIFESMNSQILKISNSSMNNIVFGSTLTIFVAVLLIDKLFVPNIFSIALFFVIVFYLSVGLISQIGRKKYSLYDHLCLTLILPIYLLIAIIEHLFGMFESLQNRIGQNYKRN